MSHLDPATFCKVIMPIGQLWLAFLGSAQLLQKPKYLPVAMLSHHKLPEQALRNNHQYLNKLPQAESKWLRVTLTLPPHAFTYLHMSRYFLHHIQQLVFQLFQEFQNPLLLIHKFLRIQTESFFSPSSSKLGCRCASTERR